MKVPSTLCVDPMKFVHMMREAGNVQRWHVVPTVNGGERVGQHTYGVLTILIAMLGREEASPGLLKAALFHDLPECKTGDCPAPTKWENPDLAKILKRVEDRLHEDLGTKINLSDKEHVLLAWADMLDLLFFCCEQRQLGNRAIEPVFWRGVDYLKEKYDIAQYSLAIGKQILDHLIIDGPFSQHR